MERLASRGGKRLIASKLQNADDVVQDHLTEISNRGRPAARVGRPRPDDLLQFRTNNVVNTRDFG